MVRARFPGKPAKFYSRKKCSIGVNSLDVEGFTVAEELVKLLGVFDSLSEDVDGEAPFLGFTPSDVRLASRRANNKFHGRVPKKKERSVNKVVPKKKNSSLPTTVSEEKDLGTPANHVKSNKTDEGNSVVVESSVVNGESRPESTEPSVQAAESSVQNAESNIQTTLSGKFVLPSRSAHSSRVIKPNKRFLETEPDSTGRKRARYDANYCALSEVDRKGDCESDGRKSGSFTSPSSKVILRKPKLKLKSQSFSFEGPFSSGSTSSLACQDSTGHSRPSTKVVCGVCGNVRLYKNLQHARKFGIFSCESCRKFIVKVLKMDREGQLDQFDCTSGNGSCQIRRSAFQSNTFPNETEKKARPKSTIYDRCQGCWLYFSLRSFQLPKEVIARLEKYLPNSLFGKLSNMSKTGVEEQQSADPSVTSPLTCTSPTTSNRNRPRRVFRKSSRSPNPERPETKKSLLKKSKLNVKALLGSGPRVKHVCRSASQVLGQPAATFSDAKINKDGETKPSKSDKNFPSLKTDQKKSDSTSDSETLQDLVIEIDDGGLPPEASDDSNQSDLNSYRPVARMLQDLGKYNCELLDGIENEESENMNAKVCIDFWQTYDPDEAVISGFPLLSALPFPMSSICFLCGSGGHHKLLHCLSCCDPYHTFCVPNMRAIKETSSLWKINWICPKCTQCDSCQKLGGNQVNCKKCNKSYHSSCLPDGRCNTNDKDWICPNCLCCKSCNGPSVDIFIGNLPLCNPCFRLRKKGNYCPLCQRCYDENDYSTKMMECAGCKCWVHADCEGLTEEKYQVLSYLPSHIEFVCRLCCKKPPSRWSLAVDAELKAGYLNVLKTLIKNKTICSAVKSTPKKKHQCLCKNPQCHPITLPSLTTEAIEQQGIDPHSNSLAAFDGKSSDFGLLTPKMTKDDEESLKSVKSDFLDVQVVISKDGAYKRALDRSDIDKACEDESNTKLLSIARSETNLPVKIKSENSHLEIVDTDLPLNSEAIDVKCDCCLEQASKPSLSFMFIKNKANNNYYSSVADFNQDVITVIEDLKISELSQVYLNALKQAFPWFDSKSENQSLNHGKVASTSSSLNQSNLFVKAPKEQDDKSKASALRIMCDEILTSSGVDHRVCMFCKALGEGLPSEEERLLYCGNGEWVHANCALWSSEVFEEIDGSLQNVHSAISRARLIRCHICNKKGASLGCCTKGCPMAFHFSCALKSDCILLENKEVYCSSHKGFTESKEVQKDFWILRSIYVELDKKKKKDIPRELAKLIVGCLQINKFGEVFPEVSDQTDFILPIEFDCSRLYWSTREPWKLVKYNIRTKLVKEDEDFSPETDVNYTIDHSLDFTPPPSPVEDVSNPLSKLLDEKDVKFVISKLIDNICLKEEENNLADQQANDLLPPEIKDVIFDDLPQDLLAGICMQDIFPKIMSCDCFVTSEHNKVEKLGSNSVKKSSTEFTDVSTRKEVSVSKKSTKDNSKNNKLNFSKIDDCKQVNLKCKLRSSVRIPIVDLSRSKVSTITLKNSKGVWEKNHILQVDGQIDSSGSETEDCAVSNIEQKIPLRTLDVEDKPVKCTRCHRTYRSNLGFTRHLSSCNSESSCSESESSEDDKPCDTPVNTESGTCPIKTEVTAVAHEYNCDNVAVNAKVEASISNAVTEDCSVIVQTNERVEYGVVNGDYSVIKEEGTAACASVSGFQSNSTAPTIVIQQLPPDPISFMNPYQQPPIQQPNIQYVQEQPQILSTGQLLPPGYQIQSPINHQVMQNVPTLLGTMVANPQPIILNNQNPLGGYGPQSTLVISNPPLYVNMETVVSNTIMSSSQLISSSTVPGILETSSYSATTTQVFHSAKPSVEVPQSYVVVNGSPQVIGNPSCPAQLMPGGTMIQSTTNGIQSTPWGSNYQVNYQDTYKLDKNVSFQSVTRQIICEEKKVEGVQMINSTQETIVIEPVVVQNNQVSLQGNSSCEIIHTPLAQKPSNCLTPPQIRITEITDPPPVNQQQNSPRPQINNFTTNNPTLTNNSADNELPTSPKPIISKISPTVTTHCINRCTNTTSVAPISKFPLKPQADPLNLPKKSVPNCPPVNKFKSHHSKIVDLPSSNAVAKEKPQQAVAPVVIKNLSYLHRKRTPNLNNFHRLNKISKPDSPRPDVIPPISKISPIDPKESPVEKPAPILNGCIQSNDCYKEPVKVEEKDDKPPEKDKPVIPDVVPEKDAELNKTDKPEDFSSDVKPTPNALKPHITLVSTQSANKKNGNGGPRISYEISSEDGFCYTTDNIVDAWGKVFGKVQEARISKGLPPLTQNPFTDPTTMLKGLMGLGNSSVKFILEQLPGMSRCDKYTPLFHKKRLTTVERELRKPSENRTGCARSEPLTQRRKSYDMFSWLASRHRRPPHLLPSVCENTNVNRRNTSLNLPMAMRFRHLKETSKTSVGVFRSDIHGRGLFCLRNIDGGEMVIEYAGELIRSSLTDTRERYYTARGMGCYMFRIDDKFVVDATMKGNAARFINHSCEPNCYSRIVDILGKKHILIFALRRIKQGEELTYDYKFPLEEDKISCHCLSRKCRKYLN